MKRSKSKYHWHKWFAWHPVEIDNLEVRAIVFFETIERCRVGAYGGDYWEYRFAE